ncbi:ABC transporter permease subunit [Streptomonospora salina]|uniref:ABC-type transport system involved in multi-copper enzyme maturation permease subunit n=1 Tax=Streptomonospora salina TaxID=104205 RepID=A0A841E8Z9_9ACTN|nr:ABC transporter permease subunit [Streptomonospora salina]MBB6000467.1 ABC-type transport system involved in multi-copper enzyme maturation permease subunit [Streptomonospora salina]
MAATAQTRGTAPHQASGGGLPGAVAAEWTKLWGLRSTWLCLAVAVLATAGTAVLAAVELRYSDNTDTPAANSLVVAATLLSQFAVVAVAALSVTGEYATGAMRTTLSTVPRRGRMVLAKVAVLAVATFAAGCAAGAVVIATTAAMFGDAVIYETAPVLHGVVGVGGYMAGLALFTLGLGLLLRSTAGAITTVVGVVLALPMISQMISNDTLDAIVEHMPARAGTTLMAGTGDPYSGGVAALLLAGWAAVSLVLGFAALARRDT